MAGKPQLLILGLGNSLLSDEGIGPAVIEALHGADIAKRLPVAVRLVDGGTLGLALLPEIQDATDLIVVDAARFDGAPGAVRVFEAEAMDAQLGRTKSSVHEVALSDLIDAARLSGTLPSRRALIGIMPQTTGWGLAPSQAVAPAIAVACETIEALIARWFAEPMPSAPDFPDASVAALPSGMADAVMHEVAARLERFARSGVPDRIDLTSIPLTRQDRAAIEQALGQGEVAVTLRTGGESQIWETAYAGVWFVRHFGAGQRIANEAIEIAPVPAILLSHRDDIRAAARRLAGDLRRPADDLSVESRQQGETDGRPSHPR